MLLKQYNQLKAKSDKEQDLKQEKKKLYMRIYFNLYYFNFNDFYLFKEYSLYFFHSTDIFFLLTNTAISFYLENSSSGISSIIISYRLFDLIREMTCKISNVRKLY